MGNVGHDRFSDQVCTAVFMYISISGFRWVSGMENEDRIYIDVGHLQVGALKPGCFKIGNTGGMLDNILTSKLYRPGR